MTLTGCATIPVSGPVHAGSAPAGPTDTAYVRVLPVQPQPGATPTQIVHGFLQASRALDDPAAAAAFLTPDAAADWSRDAAIHVYHGTPAIAAGERSTHVSVQAELAGTLSSDGIYTPAKNGQRLHATFRLARHSGQWRIATLPDGLWLTEVDLRRGWRPLHAYYLDASGSRLVPDPVLVRQGGGLATVAVRRLLAGPSSWLQGAGFTAFPPGTTLLGSVPVLDGVARVDLTQDALGASPRAREDLSAQLVWTLAQVPGVQAVQITVDGVPMTVPNAARIQPVESWFSYDPAALPAGASPYVVRSGRLGTLAGPTRSQFTPVQGDAAPYVAQLDQLAVAPDGRAVAGLSDDGRSLLIAQIRDGRADDVPRVRLNGRALTGPSMDVVGTTWVVDGGGPPVLWAVPRVGAPLRVAVSMSDGERLADVAVARDGARLLIVTSAPDGANHLYVAGIVGQASRAAARAVGPVSDDVLRLGPLRRLRPSVDRVVDVLWASADEIAVLGSSSDGTLRRLQVEVVSLDGLATRTLPTPPDGAIALTAAPGAGPVYLLAGGNGPEGDAQIAGESARESVVEGMVYELAGHGWEPVGPGEQVTYPG